MIFWRVTVMCALVPFIVFGAEKSFDNNWEKHRENHWAFTLPEQVEIPKTDLSSDNPIDSFIKQKLDEAGLTSSPRASKEVLVRRLYQALTGLEPSYDEVQAFVNNQDPKAYESLIEKLLASPRYGEKWGRHWLDVARYSDGTGYVLPGVSGILPYSWTYRDYVIRSFNEDKPYNEFVMQQLAADLMELEDKRDLAALGFIRLGQNYRNMRERPHEMVDVATQSFLALTVSCARCHDHKFDPIPTADYYSLFGVFKSIQEPPMEEFPIIYESSDPVQKKAFEEEFAKHTKNMDDFKLEAANELMEFQNKSLADYFKQSSIRALKMKPGIRTHRGLQEDLNKFLQNNNEARKSPFLKLWNLALKDPKNLKKHVANVLADKQTPQVLKEEIQKLKNPKRNDIFKAYINLADALNKKDKKILNALMKEYSAFFTGHFIKRTNLFRYINSGIGKLKPKYIRLDNKIKQAWSHPGGPAKAMIVRESSRPYEPYVFIRGQRTEKGPKVPRRYLQVLSKDDGLFKNGSGRLEFAQRVASRDNPLTARVIVNRVWAWHFGKGIVRTPSNFGLLATKPSHPELLDYLANWFMDNGWSIKKLQKLITTSKAFMQSSNYRAEAANVDGENVYLWRKDASRKTWEQLRDSVIQSSGSLKHRDGGVAVELLTSKEANIRTVYGLLNRRNLPGPFKYFDFPSTTVTCEARSNTISPQQGLFLMNSEFSARYAQKIADSLEGETDLEKIHSAYKKVLSRLPAKSEQQAALKFVQEARELYKNIYSRWEYGYAQLEGKGIKNFKAFKVYKNGRWQVGEKFPDPDAGYAFLSAKGGHPGKGKDKAVVRRCHIYADGVIKISGKMIHLDKKTGDGVRVRILHNNNNIGEWRSKGKAVPTESGEIQVKDGDIIDLVVDSMKTQGGDTFEWPMEMNMNMQGAVDTWSVFDIFSNKQKSGITYSVWSCLAQTLTMSNEFIYVD